jgi:DNA (cytosine-5)-methyltransferase 1
VRTPRLIDLFCKAGGATKGYQLAGFEVTGIDIEPQPNYCGDMFIQGDIALATVEVDQYGGRWLNVGGHHLNLSAFDAIHASPPCQRYTALRSVFDSLKYADLVAPTRALLDATGLPWVIENVVGAPLRRDLVLCSAPFGLRAYRHRIFELSGFAVAQPTHPKHTVAVNRRKKNRRGHWDAGGFVTVVGDIGRYVGPEAMGIDWMTGNELSQAIPPVYTEYIGKQLMEALKVAA